MRTLFTKTALKALQKLQETNKNVYSKIVEALRSGKSVVISRSNFSKTKIDVNNDSIEVSYQKEESSQTVFSITPSNEVKDQKIQELMESKNTEVPILKLEDKDRKKKRL